MKSISLFILLLLFILLINNTISFCIINNNKNNNNNNNKKTLKLNLWENSSSKYCNEIGSQPPLGFFDPLGILNDADQDRFDRLRYVEMKHGRIAMLSILGHIITTYGIRLSGNLPGYDNIKFVDIPNGIAAIEKLPQNSLIELIILIGLLEIGFSLRQEDIEEAQLRASGWDQDTINRKIGIELNNGRAAQMGILALMFHEKIDNNPYIINSLLGYPVIFNDNPIIIQEISTNYIINDIF